MGLIEAAETIETRRLLLRAPRLDDAARLAQLADDYEVTKMTGRMPHPYGLQDAVQWIEKSASADPRAETSFVIELEDEGPVGGFGLFYGEEPCWEVGYWIGRPYWGRGLASEALAGVVAWACGRKRRRVLVAGHFADNPASGVVLEKAGFLYTGVVKPLASRARGCEQLSRRMIRLA